MVQKLCQWAIGLCTPQQRIGELYLCHNSKVVVKEITKDKMRWQRNQHWSHSVVSMECDTWCWSDGSFQCIWEVWFWCCEDSLRENLTLTLTKTVTDYSSSRQRQCWEGLVSVFRGVLGYMLLVKFKKIVICERKHYLYIHLGEKTSEIEIILAVRMEF